MKNLKFLVIGRARSGKDTVAEILCRKLNCPKVDVTLRMVEILGLDISEKEKDPSPNAAWRKVWFDKMGEFLDKNGADYFATKIYEETQVLIGTRKISEFTKIVQTHNPYVIYINADERLGVTSNEFEITLEYANLISDRCFMIENSKLDYSKNLENIITKILDSII